MDSGALSPAEQWIHSRRAQWEQRLDSLGSYLANSQEDSDDAD